MRVVHILEDKGGAVFSITPEASLESAARELLHKKVGALVVCAGEQVVGVFSERDLVRAIGKAGADALKDAVEQWMTRDVVFADRAESVGVLMERMTDRRIRHLPVMDSGRLAGVVSIGDVVKCQIAEARNEAESLKSYISQG